jgi:hypothetical protein
MIRSSLVRKDPIANSLMVMSSLAMGTILRSRSLAMEVMFVCRLLLAERNVRHIEHTGLSGLVLHLFILRL